MNYEDAFKVAVLWNSSDREPVRIYKIEGVYWATTLKASPRSDAVLIGEVRRMCPR